MIKRTINREHLSSIREVIEGYAEGADTRNAEKLDAAFHDLFRVVAITPDGVRNLDKATYLSLIKDEKIGGSPRELDIEWIVADGNTARAEVKLAGPNTVFHDDLSFVCENDNWQIVNNVTHVEAR